MEQQSATMAMVDHTLKSDKFKGLSENYNKIRVLEPLITSDIKKTISDLKTSISGLEFSVKTASSVEDKLLRKNTYLNLNKDNKNKTSTFSLQNMLSQFKDIIRYTEICNHEDITQITKRTIDSMEKRGYVLSGIKNRFSTPLVDTGYKGMHLNFISPYGQEIELQVHSKESFDAKQNGHVLYEQVRKTSVLKKDAILLNQKMHDLYANIKKPPKIDEIQNYRMPEWKKEQLLEKGRKNTSVVYKNAYTKSGSEATCFSVYYKSSDVPILEGYENQYPDNSVKHYHIDRSSENDFAIITSIDDKGREIASHNTAIRSKTLEEVKQIADKTVGKHAEFIKELYPNMDKEEFEELENNVDLKNHAPYISELEDIDIEEH